MTLQTKHHPVSHLSTADDSINADELTNQNTLKSHIISCKELQ